MNLKQKISHWLSTKYLFVVRREENFSVKTSFSVTYARIFMLFFLGFVFSVVIGLVMAKTVMAPWFDPEYLEMENNRKIMGLSITVDSLLEVSESREVYLANLKSIIGEDTVNLSLTPEQPGDVLTNTDQINLMSKSAIDLEFRKEFEGMGIEDLSNQSTAQSQITELFFFSPIQGVVSSSFNPKLDHFGLDIVSQKNEPVKVVADGTVLMASWTQDAGYVIAVQHANDLISVYKHNASLLKKVGNFVRGGEIISIIGNTGELTSGQHLHFELWYKGNPLNPEEFISF
ncbi:M23 family metallopeptidase [Penaeicola halotolerans]|uniref:M23 family metallopeptidase n=1 Tax=Penaeicola halotolerans TaxID=2793196 RepID=UPI001CF8A7A6|nr:M23 family metallopeptidase [Penaeicola halotolerans]